MKYPVTVFALTISQPPLWLLFLSFTGPKACADNQPTAMCIGYSHNLHMVCSLCSFNEGLMCSSSLKMLYAYGITHILFENSFHSRRLLMWLWGNRPNSSSTFSVWNEDSSISLPGLFWTGCFLVRGGTQPGFITNLCLLYMSLGAGTGVQPPLLPGWARGDVTKGGSRQCLSSQLCTGHVPAITAWTLTGGQPCTGFHKTPAENSLRLLMLLWAGAGMITVQGHF